MGAPDYLVVGFLTEGESEFLIKIKELIDESTCQCRLWRHL